MIISCSRKAVTTPIFRPSPGLFWARASRTSMCKWMSCRGCEQKILLLFLGHAILIKLAVNAFMNRGVRHVQQRDYRRCNRIGPLFPCRESCGKRDYRSDQLGPEMAGEDSGHGYPGTSERSQIHGHRT